MILASEFDNCANCGKSQYSVSNLTETTFMVNTEVKCGHRFCRSCIDRELSKKRQFACPKCGTMVSSNKLSAKSMDEAEAERDIAIRKKIKSIYNKTEADFPSVDEFKNYEEMVEDLIYSFVNEIDVQSLNKQVEKYKEENSTAITINQRKKIEDFKEESRAILSSEEQKANSDALFKESFISSKLKKEEQKRQMNQIMLGEGDAMKTFGDLPPNLGLADPPPQLNPELAGNISNPVMIFLNQRPLPQPVQSSTKPQSVRDNVKRRRMHEAGGYDFKNYEKRNWMEIKFLLRQPI